MQNITIGRYRPASDYGIEVPEGSVDVADEWAGYIEGTREDGSGWILWIDAAGNPSVFYAQREADGGIIEPGIPLSV